MREGRGAKLSWSPPLGLNLALDGSPLQSAAPADARMFCETYLEKNESLSVLDWICLRGDQYKSRKERSAGGAGGRREVIYGARLTVLV